MFIFLCYKYVLVLYFNESVFTKQILCLFSQACGCPLYWKASMFICAGGERTGFVSVHSFIATWRKWASLQCWSTKHALKVLSKSMWNNMSFNPYLQVIAQLLWWCIQVCLLVGQTWLQLLGTRRFYSSVTG